MPCLLERSLKDIESELLRFCKGLRSLLINLGLSSAQTRLIWRATRAMGFLA